MSVLDNALQQLFKNGCKIKKLWTNASPTSLFKEQKINLTSSNYDVVLAEFKTSKSATASEYCRICFKGKSDWADAFANANLNEVVEIRTRQYAVSSTGVQFQQGYGKSITNTGTSVRNDYAIPLTIYGIQLLGGAIHKLKPLAAPLFGRKEVKMSENKVTDPTTGERAEVIDVQLYALNLAEDGRILSATEDQYGAEGQPRVATLPSGETPEENDISNYRYVDGEYIYDPLPQPEPPEPAPEYATYDELAEAIREGVNSYGIE